MPYWFDDESVRPSIIASAPLPPPLLNRAEIETRKPRFGGEALQQREAQHPLLGSAPTLRLIQETSERGAHSLHECHCTAACCKYKLRQAADHSCLWLTHSVRCAEAREQARIMSGPPEPTWFDRVIGAHKPRMRAMPMKIEPKTFFANERTFLHWLHMAVTIGSIASALLGFASTADRCVQ